MDRVARAARACAVAWGLGGVLGGAPVAQAAVVTFDDMAPGFQGDGGSVLSGGFRFTQVGDFGGVADGASFDGFGLAPLGNATAFYAGFNDSALTMTREGGGSFRLAGLAYGFVAPAGHAAAPGAEPGALVLQALAADGAAYQVNASWGGADDEGRFAFQLLDAGGLGPLAHADLLSLRFSACTFDESGACLSPWLNLNQFAIDDIAVVPEPPALALALLALGAGVLSLRRRGPRP